MNTVIEFGGRRSGRTTRLIEWLREGEANNEKRVLLVFSDQEATRIRTIVEDDPNNTIERWQICSFNHHSTLIGKKYSEVAIDNLEMFLPTFAAPITLITATLTEEYSTHHSYGFEPKFPPQYRHLNA